MITTKYLIELIQPVELLKKGCTPISYKKGVILKVIMESSSTILVTADSEFTFTLPKVQKDIVWQLFESR